MEVLRHRKSGAQSHTLAQYLDAADGQAIHFLFQIDGAQQELQRLI